MEDNSPIEIEGETFFMTFYEAEQSTKTINLLPIVVDAALSANDVTDGNTFNTAYTSREGQWYLILSVNDTNLKDALSESSAHKAEILQFLCEMKQEYLTRANYQEIYFKNPPSN